MLSHGDWSSIGSHAAGGRPRTVRLPLALVLISVGTLACGRTEPISPSVGQPPRLTWSPPLVYPPEMFRAGIEGRVVLEAMIDTVGKVDMSTVRVVRSTRRIFEQPAIDMLRGSQFEPGRTTTRAIRTQIRVMDMEVSILLRTRMTALTIRGMRGSTQLLVLTMPSVPFLSFPTTWTLTALYLDSESHVPTSKEHPSRSTPVWECIGPRRMGLQTCQQ